ncbi:MAG: hypothetical protein KTR31_30430 [Myxococcales bacterium]|nr:hypothetical protein [Myxococcales bacterium]
MGWFVLLLGCPADRPVGSDVTPEPPDVTVEPPTFDREAPSIACATGTPAPLLEAVLTDAGLVADDVGYTDATWMGASYLPFLDDPFLLPWFRDVHWDPLALQCHTGQVTADLDHAVLTAHPVATVLGEAMALADRAPTAQPVDARGPQLASLTTMPYALQDALAPILEAMAQAGQAARALRLDAPAGPRDLVETGHGGVLIELSTALDLTDVDHQIWATDPEGPSRLYDPARVLAFAIEGADLMRFAGMEGLAGTWSTELGPVVVAGPGVDEPGEIGAVALYLDLGGDDVYVHPVGANTARVPVAVHLDLGGHDTYGYVPTDDGTEALLPADAGGRYAGDANYGPISWSTTGRQGSGRYGVGMLFDWQGDDQYTSLRTSQGWGHLGVGVLFDGDGDDVYWLGGGGLGGGAMGIGVLLDLQGDDVYRTFTSSQGFGGARGIGIAYDAEGQDTWFADPGRAEDGGTHLYATGQLPGDSNASLSQGMGLGIRNDAEGTFLSGGVGVLRDRQGDDVYTASIFGQGSGYWQGAGYLLDGGGADAYDALWYVQGGAAHYAIGALMDDGPEGDELNQVIDPINVHVGSGHDFSVGLYVNEGGDDRVRLAGLAGGVSNCQGVGIAVDNGGNDEWIGRSHRALGLGNQSVCSDASRTQAPSIGLFLDSGGTDVYSLPKSEHPVPADDSAFGFALNGAPGEHGGAVDGQGETSIHASGQLPAAR